MESVLADPALLREPLIGKRPVHGLNDVVALTKLFQGDLGLAGQDAASELGLGSESITLKLLHSAGHESPVLVHEVACPFAWSQSAGVALIGEPRLVEPGQPFGRHVIGELGLQFDLALNAQATIVPKMPLIALVKTQGAARAATDRHARTQAMPMACGSTGEPLLSRRPAVVR